MSLSSACVLSSPGRCTCLLLMVMLYTYSLSTCRVCAGESTMKELPIPPHSARIADQWAVCVRRRISDTQPEAGAHPDRSVRLGTVTASEA